ncbi:MAG: hypothetical protein KDC33_10280, partial [Thermoleophilia bacterium]|nr:hypothetical protein [Thermoleophilia bacterium]
MLNATLGPPPAVVGARRADDAGVTKAAPSPDRDGFAGALRDAEPRRQAPARPERPRHHAAGPTNGKLPQDSDADVAGSANDTREPQASDRAVERAADDSAVARSGRDASGDASQDAPQDDQAPAQGAEVAAAIAVVPQVAPAVIEATAAKPDPADPAGTVPAATVAGQTAVAGVSPAPAATATAAASQALPSAESVADPATSAAPVDAEPQQGIAAPKGAATLTLSIGAAPAGDVIVAQAPAGPA